MSNADSTQKGRKNPKKKQGQAAAVTESNTYARARWSFIQSDLDQAANEWIAAEKAAPVKTPEEQQLEKVKNIIENLKEKLNEF